MWGVLCFNLPVHRGKQWKRKAAVCVSTVPPELEDLVRKGVLVHRRRRADYVERRVDGYQEPLDIYVVGTNHYSEESALAVERVIHAVRPEGVVVELCRSRAGMLFVEGKEVGLSGETRADFGKALVRSLRLGGTVPLLLQAVLTRIGTQTTGVDFRAARNAAEQVGSQLILGDRPIEITITRALSALSLREKVLFSIVVLRSFRRGRRDRIETIVQEMASNGAENVDQYLQKLAYDFPTLVGPLVLERDLYLTWSLKRSKAVNGTKTVVGVVGAGHLPGILRAIDEDAGNNDSPIRFKNLVSVPEKDPLYIRLARRLLLDGVLFFCIIQLFPNLLKL